MVATSLLSLLLVVCSTPVRAADPDPDAHRTLERLQVLGYMSGVQKAPAAVNVTVNDPARAVSGTNFYLPAHAPEAYLMDMTGAPLHMWRYDHDTFLREVLLPKDMPAPPVEPWFFRQAHVYPNGDLLAIFNGVALVKLDRHSNLLWAYPGRPHHHLSVQDDGTIYVLTESRRALPHFKAKGLVVDNFITRLDAEGRELDRTSILEALENGGQDDLVAQVRASNAPLADVLHTNSLRVLDGRLSDRIPQFAEGNVLISSPTLHAVMIVDLRKKAVVWTMKGRFRFQHDATLLDDGTILLFDNQRGPEARSAAMQIDPLSGAVTWEYRGNADHPLYSWCCGTCQRLAGGNTLIVETQGGRAIEVTPARDIVWEFVLPFRTGNHGDRVAQLMDLVRLGPDFPLDWVERRSPAPPTP